MELRQQEMNLTVPQINNITILKRMRGIEAADLSSLAML
jgi:hypothetical protein